MNIDLNIISQDNPVDKLYLTFTLQMPSFCSDPKDSFTIQIHIGTVETKYAIVNMNDMDMSIVNVQKAITELMEFPGVINRLMEFNKKIKITFDNLINPNEPNRIINTNEPNRIINTIE